MHLLLHLHHEVLWIQKQVLRASTMDHQLFDFIVIVFFSATLPLFLSYVGWICLPELGWWLLDQG